MCLGDVHMVGPEREVDAVGSVLLVRNALVGVELVHELIHRPVPASNGALDAAQALPDREVDVKAAEEHHGVWCGEVGGGGW